MNTLSSIIRNLKIFVAILAIAGFAANVNAEELKAYNPYTVVGHQLRSELITQSPFGDERPVHMGPTLFQEVIPCRFVSTLDEDKYPAPWGGKAFEAKENRTYFPIGQLVSGDWTNPCSDIVDSRAIAVALRIMAYDPNGSGAVWVAPSTYNSYNSPAVKFNDGNDAMREADVALHGASFRVQPDEATHLVIDIIGYFIADPNGYGPRGEKGDKGDRGEAGAQGLQGEKGDRGEAGAQGLKGDKGDNGEAGAQGAKGDKGDRGEAGAQGLQGEKGDRGEAGAQGLKGDKGDRGEAGAQGLKGDKGDKGDRGEAGAQGLKGDKGDKGDRGEAGAQGLKGDKGDAGAQGLQGPMGPQGPQGPPGQSGGGVAVITGAGVFPPPGTLTISHPAITGTTPIVLVYSEVSNGNALAVVSQTNGRFTVSGSPNKPFRWIAFVMNN